MEDTTLPGRLEALIKRLETAVSNAALVVSADNPLSRAYDRAQESLRVGDPDVVMSRVYQRLLDAMTKAGIGPGQMNRQIRTGNPAWKTEFIFDHRTKVIMAANGGWILLFDGIQSHDAPVFETVAEAKAWWRNDSQRGYRPNPADLPGFPTGSYPRPIRQGRRLRDRHGARVHVNMGVRHGEWGVVVPPGLFSRAHGDPFHKDDVAVKFQDGVIELFREGVVTEAAGEPRHANAAPMSQEALPAALAAEFSRVLARWLGPKKMAEVVKLNRASKNPNICYSHNFCDANMAMDEAFLRVLGRRRFHPADIEADPSIDARATADLALWNRAWNLAKAAGFRPLSINEKKRR